MQASPSDYIPAADATVLPDVYRYTVVQPGCMICCLLPSRNHPARLLLLKISRKQRDTLLNKPWSDSRRCKPAKAKSMASASSRNSRRLLPIIARMPAVLVIRPLDQSPYCYIMVRCSVICIHKGLRPASNNVLSVRYYVNDILNIK